MYRFVWDRMPFGRPGKIASLVALLTGVVVLLWFVVFPAADALLPFNNVQVTSPSGSPTDYATVVATPTQHPTGPAGPTGPTGPAGPSTPESTPIPTATAPPS